MTGQTIMANDVHSQQHVATARKPHRATRGVDVRCPHCGKNISRSAIAKSIARSGVGAGRKPVLRPCRKCGDSFGARALRAHEPVCTGIPGKPRKGKP
jgi:predicted RNA-binding Zn-ribbon protein involved in translation (DUF1610 family)